MRLIILAACGATALSCTPQRPAPRTAPPGSVPTPLVAVPTPLVAVPTTLAAPESPGTLPGPTELGTFWEPWFASPYEYMFTSPAGLGWEESPAAASQGRVFGGGINGFYFYGGFDDCLRSWMGQEKDYGHDEYASLSTLAGRPFRTGQVGDGWDRSFGQYDPAVINWALSTFVPHPTQTIRGQTFQAVYDQTFFRAIRLHALAYDRLQMKYNLDREAKAYLKAMRGDSEFYGVEWLQNRYAGELQDAYPLEWDGTMMTAPMAMGFWLRRHVDGTEDSLTRGIGVVLRIYDPSFVENHSGQMHWFGGTSG
jgi:hypothetical protein